MKKIFGSIVSLTIATAILLVVFYMGCMAVLVCLQYPVFILLALALEAMIFVPWELESREKCRTHYRKEV